MSVESDQPVGEWPDVPARAGGAAVLEAADRVGAHVQAVAEIRKLHESRPMASWWDKDENPVPGCKSCLTRYPCPTVQILDRLVP